MFVSLLERLRPTMAYALADVKYVHAFHAPRRIKKAPLSRGCSLDSYNFPHVVISNDNVLAVVVRVLLIDIRTERCDKKVQVIFPGFFYLCLVLIVSPVGWDYF